MNKQVLVKIGMIGLIGLFSIGCSKAPDVPDWWHKSDTKGYITGRGDQKPNKQDDLSEQNDFAMLAAQGDLARKVEARVQKLLSKEGDGGDAESTRSSSTKAATNKVLRSFKLLKSEYADDGRLFILLGVKRIDVDKIVDKK
jgi:hypothetical protein